MSGYPPPPDPPQPMPSGSYPPPPDVPPKSPWAWSRARHWCRHRASAGSSRRRRGLVAKKIADNRANDEVVTVMTEPVSTAANPVFPPPTQLARPRPT